MLEQARSTIQAALAGSTSPAVLCSFGKDSLLVLALAREINPNIPVLWFRTGSPEQFARQLILDWDLTVLSPAPSDRYLLANGLESTMIYEYRIGEHSLPVLQDLEPGTTCSLAPIDLARPLYYPFDLLLTGWKDTDTHWIKGDVPLPPDGTICGRAIMVSPIRHMTDSQVMAAINHLGLPYQQVPDTLPICTACMTGPTRVFCPKEGRVIPSVQWNPTESLTAFRRRFNLEEANGSRI